MRPADPVISTSSITVDVWSGGSAGETGAVVEERVDQDGGAARRTAELAIMMAAIHFQRNEDALVATVTARAHDCLEHQQIGSGFHVP